MSPEGWGKAVGDAGFDDYRSSVEAEDGFKLLFTAKVPQTHPATQYTSSEPVFLSYTFGQEMAQDPHSRRHHPNATVDPG